jgi:hypothetical protein
MLADKYHFQGFKISGFGVLSQALKRFGRVVYVFKPGFQERLDFINALCECHLKLSESKYDSSYILNYGSLSDAHLKPRSLYLSHLPADKMYGP